MTNTTTQVSTSFTNLLARFGGEHKAYQLNGVQWCVDLERRCGGGGGGGGLLADEMGLGKTLTMLGTMVCNFKQHTLLVLPMALIEQWRAEILRITGHRALVYHGSVAKRNVGIAELMSAPVVIVTYHCVGKYEGENKSLIHAVEWDRVVFDEAHHLRNGWKTAAGRGANALRSKMKWLVTGTPMQNGGDDLRRLGWVMGLPSNVNFVEWLSVRMLRRTKRDVGLDVSLATLSENHEEVEWNRKEEDLAGQIHAAIPRVGREDRLRLYTAARKSCILSSMLSTNLAAIAECVVSAATTTTPSSDTVDTTDTTYIETTNKTVEDFERRVAAVLASDVSGRSKVERVVNAVLSNAGNGAGKLVFCHFIDEINILVELLSASGLRVAAVDGRVTGSKRAAILAGKYDALVLQIQTGCEGLNLQRDFSEVYFVSPHWNPAVEDQAVGRCYRLGQTKAVNVFRFAMTAFGAVAGGTLDAYVNQIQNRKRAECGDVMANLVDVCIDN